MSQPTDPDSNSFPTDGTDEHAFDGAPADRFDSDDLDAAHQDAAQEPIVETRDEEMERLRGEVDQANKRVLQAQAEAENFRKRLRRDADEQIKFASLPLVSDLLEVRDNLIRAIEAADLADSTEGLRDGVAICAKQLDDMLSKHGIKEIPTEGELFDPNYHEAISQMPSPDHAEGMVSHVAQSGFQMHERVVRPSQVVVSSGGPQ